jgi:glutamate/tyrosine decarboxylase-like PLP-dependent enzyme
MYYAKAIIMTEEQQSRLDFLREKSPRKRHWRIPEKGIVKNVSTLQKEIGLENVMKNVESSKEPIMIELSNAMHRIPAFYRSHEEMAKPGTINDPIASMAYVYTLMMANPNSVDMEMFYGAYEMAQEAKAMTSHLLGLSPTFSVDTTGEWVDGFVPHHVGGWFLNGGTESIQQAIWTFRNKYFEDKFGNDDIRSKGYRNKIAEDIPVVIAPINAHFALDKSTEIVGLGKGDSSIKRFYLNQGGKPEPESFRKQIKNTLAHGTGISTVFITAGDTERGIISDTSAMAKVLRDEYKRKGLENKLPPIIVDAAAQYLFAAVMDGSDKYVDIEGIPMEIPKWDFRVPEVEVIVTDPHKNEIPYPASILIYRNAKLANLTQMEEAYLSTDMLKHVTGMPPGEMNAAQACSTIPTSRAAYGSVATWAYYVGNGLDKIRQRKEKVWANVLHVWKALDEGSLSRKYERLFTPQTAIINMRLSPDWVEKNISKFDNEIVRKADKIAEAYEYVDHKISLNSVLSGELTFKVYENINKNKGDMLYIGKSTELKTLSEQDYHAANEVKQIFPGAGHENTGLLIHVMEHNRIKDMNTLVRRLNQEANKLFEKKPEIY